MSKYFRLKENFRREWIHTLFRISCEVEVFGKKTGKIKANKNQIEKEKLGSPVSKSYF